MVDILKIIGLRKSKPQVNKNSNLPDLLHRELHDYIKKEDLQKYIAKINSDKETKRKWDSMSTRQKLLVLRHVATKRGIK